MPSGTKACSSGAKSRNRATMPHGAPTSMAVASRPRHGVLGVRLKEHLVARHRPGQPPADELVDELRRESEPGTLAGQHGARDGGVRGNVGGGHQALAEDPAVERLAARDPAVRHADRQLRLHESRAPARRTAPARGSPCGRARASCGPASGDARAGARPSRRRPARSRCRCRAPSSRPAGATIRAASP